MSAPEHFMAENQARRQAYDASHRHCPECGSTRMVTTTMGMLCERDTNRAVCQGCGWKGIVHDLLPGPKVMTPDAAFLRAVCETPEDDTPRLIYADWLEEHGDGARAEFIRVQCESARLADPAPPGVAADTPFPRERLAFLRRRERELLTGTIHDGAVTEGTWGHRGTWGNFRQWAGEPLLAVVPDGAALDDHLTFRRGFVAAVTLTTQAYLDHAAAIFAAAPVEEVRLSDREPEYASGFGWTFWRWDELLDERYIPDCLFAHFKPRWNETREGAFDRLSEACVCHGRALAGLPPPPRAAEAGDRAYWDSERRQFVTRPYNA